MSGRRHMKYKPDYWSAPQLPDYVYLSPDFKTWVSPPLDQSPELFWSMNKYELSGLPANWSRTPNVPRKTKTPKKTKPVKTSSKSPSPKRSGPKKSLKTKVKHKIVEKAYSRQKGKEQSKFKDKTSVFQNKKELNNALKFYQLQQPNIVSIPIYPTLYSLY